MTDADKKVKATELEVAQDALLEADKALKLFEDDIANPSRVAALDKFVKAYEKSIRLGLENANLAYTEALENEKSAGSVNPEIIKQLQLRTQIARVEKEIADVLVKHKDNSMAVYKFVGKPPEIESDKVFRQNHLVAIEISKKNIEKLKCLIELETVEDKITKFRYDIKKEKASIVENKASVIKYDFDIYESRIYSVIAEISSLMQNPLMKNQDKETLENMLTNLKKMQATQVTMEKRFVDPDKINKYEQAVKRYKDILDFRVLEEEARAELRATPPPKPLRNKENLQDLAKGLVVKPKLEKKKPLYTPPSFFTNVVNFFRKKLVPQSIAKQAAVVFPQPYTNSRFNKKNLADTHQKLESVSSLFVREANFELYKKIKFPLPTDDEVRKYFNIDYPNAYKSVFGERHLDGSIEVYKTPQLGVGAMIREDARYRGIGVDNRDKLISKMIEKYKMNMREKDPNNSNYKLLLEHEKKILIPDTMRTMLDEALVEVNELNNPKNEDRDQTIEKIETKLTLLKNQMKELENLPKESSELRNMVQDISLLVNQMINALPEEIQEKIKNAESLPEDAVTTPLPPALEPVPPPPPLPVIPVRPGSLDAGQIAAQEGARQAIKLAQLMGKGVTSPSEQSTNISLPNSGGPPYAPAQQNAEAAYAQQAPTTTGGAHKKNDKEEPYVTDPPRTGPTTK